MSKANFAEQASTPSTPPTGTVDLYAKTDGNLYQLDDTGVETSLSSAGSVLLLTAETELTISSGSVTLTQNYHKIDTESGDTTDDLETLAGGASGQVYVLQAEDTARTVVIKHATGNIYTHTGEDITLDDTEKAVWILFDGTNYIAMSPADAGAGSGGTNDFLHYQHQESSGTAGGAATTGSWQTRTVTTEVSDAAGHGTLTTNVIALVAGTYRVWCEASMYRTDQSQLRFRNTSDSTDAALGVNSEADSTNVSNVVMSCHGEFTIASTKNFELQAQYSRTQATNGQGLANSWGTEVYADIILIKVA